MSSLLSRSSRTRRPSPVLTVLVVLLGFLTLPMSMSGTTVAIPRIGEELHASGASLQWVVTGYFLTASSFMLVSGSLGDLFGRRRIFALGAAVYTVGALGSATAGDIALLDVARTLSGAGAAGVMAGGGAILAATFEGAARTRAFAAMGTISGIGLATGPTLSGWMVGGLGWRVTFGLFAAAGLVILLGVAFVGESRAEHRPKVDRPGVASFIGGLALLMFGITQGAQAGWGSPRVLGPVGGGLLLLAVFVAVERRSDHPVLDLTLVRDRRFMGWCLAALAVPVGSSGVLVFLPTYLQGANGLSARDAGLSMLMLTAPVLFLPAAGGRLVNRGVPARYLAGLALVLLAGGNAWLTVLHPGISSLALLGPLLAIGTGNGLVAGIIDAQAMSLVEPARVGMAAGFLNTVKGGGNALVLAVIGAVLTSLIQARTGSGELAGRIAAGDLSGPGRALHAAQFTDAWHIVLWSVAALCALGAFTVHALLAPGARPVTLPGDAADSRTGRTLSAKI
ncbi:MFS transporter [Streptomyces sp. ISL-11]|uniref:MFS transporter n=1 Tax=Streptomyces sp. ISL-11 TaxID=2819174 RepID=UPI001BE528D0|nr:MFS transporter [Streptomyces sp. ISL-11]MBT2383471.1 MFS transporter [Streptomyces sp. ISL-11]